MNISLILSLNGSCSLPTPRKDSKRLTWSWSSSRRTLSVLVRLMWDLPNPSKSHSTVPTLFLELWSLSRHWLSMRDCWRPTSSRKLLKCLPRIRKPTVINIPKLQRFSKNLDICSLAKLLWIIRLNSALLRTLFMIPICRRLSRCLTPNRLINMKMPNKSSKNGWWSAPNRTCTTLSRCSTPLFSRMMTKSWSNSLLIWLKYVLIMPWHQSKVRSLMENWHTILPWISLILMHIPSWLLCYWRVLSISIRMSCWRKFWPALYKFWQRTIRYTRRNLIRGHSLEFSIISFVTLKEKNIVLATEKFQASCSDLSMFLTGYSHSNTLASLLPG